MRNNKPISIIMYDKTTGEELGKYKSITEASVMTGISKSVISRQTKYKTPIKQNVFFLYENDDFNNYFKLYKIIPKIKEERLQDKELNGEIWKGVIYQGVDYSWRFECSNYGRIRNANNKQVYTPHLSGIGYFQICTSINGKNKNIKIHKAVAETFIPNPDNLRDVNHIDGNKQNNNINNLEWVTHQDNMLHANKIGLHPSTMNTNNLWIEKTCGESSNLSKLTEEEVRYIRKHYTTYANGTTNKNELAKLFNTTPMNINSIIMRKTWKHID